MKRLFTLAAAWLPWLCCAQLWAVTPPAGCDSAFVHFPDSLLCLSEPTMSPDSVFPANGFFYCGDSTLDMDSLGNVHPQTSLPGTYEIQYIALDSCADTFRVWIEIQAHSDASFLLPDTNYCTHEGYALPILWGDSGGVFRGGSGLIVDSLSGSIDLALSMPGAHQLSYYSPGFCTDSTSVSLALTEAQNPNFSYPSPVCIADTSPLLPDTIVAPGGNFKSIWGGLVFDDSTRGEIDLNSSDPGTHLILYTTPAPCADSLLFLLEIQAQTSADFHYPDTHYCQAAGTAAPVILGQGGGRFWGDSTLTFDSLTGFVELAASDTGTVQVFYESPGFCPDTTSFDLNILPQGSANFEYVPASYCISGANPLPLVSGDTNGVFSVLWGTVGLDSLSGEIDLALSNSGDSILVQYWVPGIGLACPDSLIQRIEITAPDTSVSISYPSPTYCPDNTDPLPTISGATGGSFQAYPPGLSIDQFSGYIDLSASQAQSYLLRYFPPGACVDTSNGFSLTLHPKDELNFHYPLDEYCSNEGLAVPMGSVDTSGTFRDPSGYLVFEDFSRGWIDLDSSRAGAYLLSYTSGGHCPADSAFAFTIHPSPEALLISNALNETICEGDSADFVAFGGDQYAFSINGNLFQPFSFDNLFKPPILLSDGDQIEVVVENTVGGCTDSDSLTLEVRLAPQISFLEYDQTLSATEPFSVLVQADQDSVQVAWWFETLGPIFPPLDSGFSQVLSLGEIGQLEHDFNMGNSFELGELRYFLQAQAGGCLGEIDSLKVLVLPQEEVFIPAVITPDGNGKNDVWEIRHRASVRPENWEIQVFNRSGGEVWNQQGLAPVWNGGNLPDGVYWYLATNKQNQRQLTGGLTLKRK